MKFDKSNIVGVIGLIGAILLIVGVFLSWMELDFALGSLYSTNSSYTGMEIFQNEDGIFDDISYAYAPIVALVAGIVALITTIAPMFYSNDKVWRALGIVSLILGIVTVIIGFLFRGDVSDSFEIFGVTGSASVGTGFWISIAGGILLILGAIIDIAKKHA